VAQVEEQEDLNILALIVMVVLEEEEFGSLLHFVKREQQVVKEQLARLDAYYLQHKNR
jgi:hypothetical protein